MNLDWCKESPLNLAREEILAESLAAKGAVKRHPLLTGVYFRESPDLASSKTGEVFRRCTRGRLRIRNLKHAKPASPGVAASELALR